MTRLWIKSGPKENPVYLPLADIPEGQNFVDTDTFGRVTVDTSQLKPGEKQEQRVTVRIERYHGDKKPSTVTVSPNEGRGRFQAPKTGALIEVLLDEPPRRERRK